MAKQVGLAQKTWMRGIQTRVDATTHMLSTMKVKKHLFKSKFFIANSERKHTTDHEPGESGIATHTRSAEGSLVDGTSVNRGLLTEFLAELAGLGIDRTEDLLDPADHQNVPKTVELLEAVVTLRGLDRASLTPAQQLTHRSVRLFAELWDLLLDAFLTRELDLSAQLTDLSTFSHRLFCGVTYTTHILIARLSYQKRHSLPETPSHKKQVHLLRDSSKP